MHPCRCSATTSPTISGITFETVSRTLRFLKDRRIIRLNAVNEIEIVDVAALEALCD